MTHTRVWASSVELRRLDTAVRALTLVLNEGCWPSGLPLTPAEEATLRRNVDELLEELRRRQAPAKP